MSRVLELSVAPADTRAGDLLLRLNGPEAPLLARDVVRAGAGSLEVGIIGASHVVSVRDGAHKLVWREEISCRSLSDAPVPTPAPTCDVALPPRYECAGYCLRSRVDVAGDFVAQAGALVADLERGGWLVGRFPGAGPFHLTALCGAATADGWSWRSVHLYPGEATIVRTESKVSL